MCQLYVPPHPFDEFKGGIEVYEVPDAESSEVFAVTSMALMDLNVLY